MLDWDIFSFFQTVCSSVPYLASVQRALPSLALLLPAHFALSFRTTQKRSSWDMIEIMSTYQPASASFIAPHSFTICSTRLQIAREICSKKQSCHSRQPFLRAHSNTSKCPRSAANLQVDSFHGHPFARAHCRTASCPPAAAK